VFHVAMLSGIVYLHVAEKAGDEAAQTPSQQRPEAVSTDV